MTYSSTTADFLSAFGSKIGLSSQWWFPAAYKVDVQLNVHRIMG